MRKRRRFFPKLPDIPYMYFEALEDMTVSLSSNNIMYSLNKGASWTELSAGTSTPTIKSGEKIYFKFDGISTTFTASSSNGCGIFSTTGNFNVGGNLQNTFEFTTCENNPYCYRLFYNSLVVNSSNLILPWDTLSIDAFRDMFHLCVDLIYPPELPATTLSDSCYRLMFNGCTSLQTAPSLPATIMKSNCYRSMFCNCSSLILPPDLDSVNLALECYNVMFQGCTSLTTTPELPATTLAQSCYGGMFYECSSLTTAPELPATTLADYCYNGMFYGCTSLTTAPELPATTLAGSCYTSMFNGCTSLTTAPELPATTLNTYCYNSMFKNCTSLTTAPELPATALANYCYYYMFQGCTSLTTAPELPATTLAPYCYYYMFDYRTSLTTAPELPATTLVPYCYGNMFKNCTSLTTVPELLPFTILKLDCYEYMFCNCTSLTTAPELPATTLVSYCYSGMFNGCIKLNYIKMLAKDISASNCLKNWVYNVSTTGTFVKHPDMTSLPTGTNGIPENWTVKDNFTPIKCLSLSITADDVSAKDTQTTIYYTAEIEGLDGDGNTCIQTISNTAISDEFPQNTSTTNTVTRTISYTYMGVTATTTITQGVWVSSNFTIDLNSNWQISSISNPDSTVYNLYESYSNKGVGNSGAIMYIDIDGYTEFEFYIRSYAESSYDYVMVSQLDQELTYSTSYSNTTLVKAHTRGNQQSGTSLSNYTKVTFSGIDGGSHRICIIYRKDSSVNSGDDCGYVLIGKKSGEPINIDNYLTIEALEDGLTASLSDNACEYCIDGDGNWMSLAADTATGSIDIGHTLSFRGNLIPNTSKGIGTFTISKRCNLKGNVMSMLYWDDADKYNLVGDKYAFFKLFYNCTTIINANNLSLPATSLDTYSYYYMFGYCKSLKTAPELPAIILNTYCYSGMFSNCTSLTTAPELPATALSLASNCYSNMFYGCTKLTTAPKLPATILSYGCYSGMFCNCTSLTTAPELPATTLDQYCYSTMFYGCTNLTIVPELPAPILVNYCYGEMFCGCRNLNYIKMLATDISNTYNLHLWVSSVLTTTGTFVKHPDMTSLPTGSSGIPSGWTVLNDGEAITFTIDGTEYQVEPGMIWEEWVDSVYNEIGAYISISGTVMCDNLFIITPTKDYTYSNELILTGESYRIGDSGQIN